MHSLKYSYKNLSPRFSHSPHSKGKFFLRLIFMFILSSIFPFSTLLSENLSKEDNIILQAMRDEIQNNLKNLKLESLKSPYYIEYELVISEPLTLKSSSGVIVDEGKNKISYVNVGLRVGDYKFDNSNFFDVGLSFFGSSDDEERFKKRTIPIDIDYNTLRKELWLATDAAYKQNSEIYSKKISSMQNRVQRDTIDDFIKIKVNKIYNKTEFPSINLNYFKGVLQEATNNFKLEPEVFTNSASLECSRKTRYYVNSEGIEFITTDSYTGIEIATFSQAEDGMPISNFLSFYAKDSKNLPTKDSIVRASKLMADNVVALRKAKPLEDSYSGPILLENQAAAELFGQIIAPNFVAQRNIMTESGTQEIDRNVAYQNKVGARVLPEFLSVYDKPTVSKFQNTELIGQYTIDDDGLEAQDLDLVTNGYLKTLISGRVPNKKVKVSNAHSRGGSPIFSNLFVEHSEKSKNVTSYKELKSKLLKLIKDRNLEYGIIVKKIHNLNIYSTTLYTTSLGGIDFLRGDGNFQIAEAYKVYKDGSQELIRGIKGFGFTPQTFKDIIEVSKDYYAYNFLTPAVISSMFSGGDQYLTASIICPSLLFEDGELRTIDADFKKPPILPKPVSGN